MVQTITPVVHGGRRSRWLGHLAIHVLGATLGAAVLGIALGATGRLLGGPWGRAGLLLGAALAGAYLLREAFGIPVPLPALRRQVPRWWRSTLPGGLASLAYGLTLGVGFVTFLKAGTLVAVGGFALLGADPGTGALVMGGFGLARGLGVAVAWSGTTEERVQRVVDRLEALAVSALPRAANTAALAGIVTTASLTLGAPAGDTTAVPAATLAIVFGWAALAKIVRPAAWGRALADHPLPRWVAAPARPMVPLAESGVAALALAGQGPAAGVAALVLLGGFSVTIARAGRLGRRELPCGCFGGRRRRPVGLLLARNAGLGIVALAAIAAGRVGPLLETIRPPRAGEWLPASLAMLGALGAALALRTAARLRSG